MFPTGTEKGGGGALTPSETEALAPAKSTTRRLTSNVPPPT